MTVPLDLTTGPKVIPEHVSQSSGKLCVNVVTFIHCGGVNLKDKMIEYQSISMMLKTYNTHI